MNGGLDSTPSSAPDRSEGATDSMSSAIPFITVPKGGGAIRGIGEKFGVNPVSGTGAVTIPIATSPGPAGFGPALSLSYDSGAGNGPFGFGWSLGIVSITRKTDKGLPRYLDADESDVYILSGAEDLVPVLCADGSRFFDDTTFSGYLIHRYRPRVESSFARLERWTHAATGEILWRSISKDNVTSWYGKTAESRISDPLVPPGAAPRTFRWLICASYDDKGNAIVYEYAAENDDNVDLARANERNRVRSANRYIKRIKYGNRTANRNVDSWQPIDPAQLPQNTWMFEVLFDYDEGHYEDLPLDPTRAESDQLQRCRASTAATRPWSLRPDPFSAYRSAFEVRTYRRCRRVLMFHHIPGLPSGEKGYQGLVRSTSFDYADLDYCGRVTIESELAHQGSTRLASFLQAATQSGFVKEDAGQVTCDGVEFATYVRKSLPRLEFAYSKVMIRDQVREIDAHSLENLPVGLDGDAYRWVDIDGEGLSGILSEQGGAWYYKSNLGDGQFGPLQTLPSKPAGDGISGGRRQLMDLTGDGQLDVVDFAGIAPGFYERTQQQSWEPFHAFREIPGVAWNQPNLRFVDLSGDGLADVLITEQDAFTWYRSLGEAGFDASRRAAQPWDEEHGPRLVFADGTQSVHLADMSGDGLTDLVRIRNGEVCYWPNLGYGRFGPKVTLDNSPRFDHPEEFDQRRIRLADIDGSGTVDIIYLGRDGAQLYFNESGNRLSEPRRLECFPRIDSVSAVTATDLLGNGTACLVWSSPLPGAGGRQLRYIDLMGGQKPHLLLGVKNNLGAETRIHYVASTTFYLQDRLAGRPWITRLPFPVHVVDKVEVYDALSRTQFSTSYAYHHGYFDGVEREFRGFGLVEQWDSEAFAAFTEDAAVNLDQANALPPVLTRTWYHTGAYLEGARISLLYKEEYYREPGLGQAQLDAMLLTDTILPTAVTRADGSEHPWTLSYDEEREACRALKGAILRQETYALDGTEREFQPYSVSERNYTIQLLQPRGPNVYAVLFSHARETVDYHYERKLYCIHGRQLADPRVSHAITLAVDGYGNPLKTVAIGYGRRYDAVDPLLTAADVAKQRQTLATVIESQYTNAILGPETYRSPLPTQVRTYELLKAAPRAKLAETTNLFRFEEMRALVQAASGSRHEIPYEDINAQSAAGSGPYRRLIEQSRTLYRRDDLGGALPLGIIEPMALPFESYKLAFTPGLLAVFSAKISANESTALMTGPDGGYRDLDGDGRLWIPSGRIFFSLDPTHPDPTYARAHRFQPQGAQNPFGNLSRVSYDGHELVVARTIDALGNTVSAEFDYRVLLPSLVTDPNGNRTAAAFDTLGLLVATAIMGKQHEPDGLPKGDSLQGVVPDLNDELIDAFFADPRGHAAKLLGDATSRTVYDVSRFVRTGQPSFAATLVRETHVADLAPGQTSKMQVSFSHSDGFGREIQKKIPAEAGPIDPGGASVNPRWIGSGWTIFNNKGKPVRQYEPFFTATHAFEFAVRRGVSPTLFYDPVVRVIATLHPNHTYEKVLFDPWWNQSWDVNDTVKMDPAMDKDVAAWFHRLDPAEYTPTWFALRTDPRNAALAEALWPDPVRRAAEADAAIKAAAHAGTPSTAYFDALGRTFLGFADNGADGTYGTRVKLDIRGNQREVIDALGRRAVTHDFDLLSNTIHLTSMEAGSRWMLHDAMGMPLRSWDSRGHRIRAEYDALRRPLRSFVQCISSNDPSAEILFGKTEYGEGQANDVELNLRTRRFRRFDSAGVATNERFDFKGNLLQSTRQLAADYKTIPDWSANPTMERELFTISSVFDALNRAISVTAPDSSIYRPGFNASNLLKKVEVNLQGGPILTSVVENIDYDAKGQRERIDYGNHTSTDYIHDPLTLRLMTLKTRRSADHTLLQDMHYAYDPVGNITQISDDAQQTVYFDNKVVTPGNGYVYDPLYRLTNATGREHIGQLSQPQTNWDDQFRVHLPQPGDGHAMRRYQEQYSYDAVGNCLQLVHRAASGDWTRGYAYDDPSLIEPMLPSNRLSRTTVGRSTERYAYDVHGNMLDMQQLHTMQWDYADRLQMSQRQIVNSSARDGVEHQGERTYYVYDFHGERVRKVTDRHATTGHTSPTRMKERIYLGGFEVYREYGVDGVDVRAERETLHVMDNRQRIALVETRTIGAVESDSSASQLTRYQFANHLGSATLELDQRAQIISYEEYYPYGSTSYQAVDRGIRAAAKRYRYIAMERDEESGLSYHGARYYAPWIGRWISCDPIGIQGGINLYAYASSNPLGSLDKTGHQPVDAGIWIPSAAREADDTTGRFVPDSELEGAREIVQDVVAPVEATVGLEYGIGKALLSVIVAPGEATYYSTSYLLYEITGSDIWKDQAETYKKGVTGLGNTVSHPVSAIESYVSQRGDAIVNSWKQRDFFGLTSTIAQTATELYLIADAIGGIKPPSLPPTPSLSPVATASYALAGGAVDVGRAAPALSMMASNAASSKGGDAGLSSGSAGADRRKNFDYKENKTKSPKEQHREDLPKKMEEFQKGGGEIEHFDPSPHEHHMLPREFKQFFEAVGLNIEKFKIWLNPKTHLSDVHGGAPGGGLWNLAWDLFFQKNPAYTPAQVLNQLANLRKSFGI
jgi:RHS repeat-associated protein